jgi:hypothetical protein
LVPDSRVEGATPARQASEAGVGKRPRASPISASSRAARTVPALGSEVKMCLSGCSSSRYKAYLQTAPDAGPVRVRVQLPPAGTPAPPGPWQGERTTEIDIPDGRVWVENVSAGGLTLHPGPTDRLTLPNGPGRYRLTVWFRDRTTPSPAGTDGAHPAPDTPDPGDGPSGPEEYVIRLTYLGPLADDEDDDSEDDDSEDDG